MIRLLIMKRFCTEFRIVARLTALAIVIAVCAGQGHTQAPLGPAKTDSPITLQGAGGFFRLDLTKQDDKSQPVLRLGYQSQLSEALKKARANNRAAEIRGLWTFSTDLQGTPTDDTASLLRSTSVSSGASLNFSFGKAYLFSYVPPTDSQVLRANVGVLTTLTNAIEAEKAKPMPALTELKDAVDSVRDTMETTRKQNHALRNLMQIGLNYANSIDAYIAGTAKKPLPPEFESINLPYQGPLYDAWYVRLGFSGNSHTLFDSTKPFADQFTKKDFQGYSAQLGYNVNFGGNLPIIIGVSGGVMQTNNADQLSSTEVTETQSFTSADGITKRGTSRKRTGLVGDYKQYKTGTGKIDLVFYPDLNAASRDPKKPRSSFAFDVFGRASGGGTPTVYGVGTYITQPGAPTKIYGGLNVYRAENKHLAVDIVAGFPF